MQNEKMKGRSAVLAVMLIAAIAGALMQTSLGTALPTLMKAFDIDLATAQQASTWFLLVNGMMVPLSAYLARRIKTKTLHLVAYFLLLAGILTSMWTPENADAWWLFLAGRILAAMAVGIMLPLSQIVVLNMYGKSERGAAMGMLGLVIGMSPAVGPTLTGWILDKNHELLGLTLSDSWRSMFVIPLLILLVAIVLTPFFMKNVVPNKKMALDISSVFLSTVGFGLFLWGFTNVATDGWTAFGLVILPIVLGALILLAFVWRQLKLPLPFLDARVFAKKNFTIPTIGLLLTMMAMFGVEMMLPTYLQNVRGMTPLDSGLTLMWGALFMGFLSPVAGGLYNKVGIKKLAFVGFSMLSLGTLPYLFLTAETPTVLISVLYAVRMAGIALTMMPLTTAAMAALPDEQNADGTAANNTLRQVSASIVVAILTSIVQNIVNTKRPSHALKISDPLQYADKVMNASLDGFRVAFLISLGIALLGIVLTFWIQGQKEETAC
ncbi:DHA2 family efflux MFS transporter permease subunit [Fructobacillus sp. M158]|uniref:DHA2 family efflux MFS transporter permease subunit n=1 Tax=Fructobacillus parabroussonetiae TaxID=2713174 RepID=UPI002009E28E|nr:DHA2 family efflux MFS transporter permease subunit [Fructobacillus parabroussonetiae]MCK8617385.1 DHA2 family efflux MFS transporter permease subunit [Fructobacillus parabroussonetiae]